MINNLTKELAESLVEMRNFADIGEIPAAAYMVRADAVLDRYVDALRTPEPKMTINLKDYEGKFVVVTLRNEWRIVSLVYKNGGDEYDYKCFPYSIDGKNYSNDGRVLITAESPYDIIDIKLVDEDACKTPEETKMTINLKDYEGKFVVVTLRNEWRIVSLVYTNDGYSYSPYFPYSIDGKYYSNNGKVFSFEKSPYDIVDIKLVDEDPEPVITRVEVITDNGREYVSWNKDNVITTSLQDDGKTLKIFVNKVKEDIDIIKECRQTGRTRYTTKKLLDKVFGEQMTEIEEPEMPITKPEFYDNLPPGDKTRYNVAEKEVSKQWAKALTNFINELDGDWDWKGLISTPEKVVECLRENIQYLQQLAADEELEACVEWVSIQLNCTDQEHLVPYLREYRRPKPTLKSQALKDFETVRKHSDLLPEILDTIENALKSIPE